MAQVRSWNGWFLALFAPVLVLTGVLGLLLPPGHSPMSAAPPYDVFHIVFGALGLVCLATRRLTLMRAFLVGFGAIDLYQAVAHWLGLFPLEYFQWKTADDVLHVVLGLLLVGVGALADRRPLAVQTAR